MDTVEDRVACGLAWIKENQGRGFDVTRIDVERLNVASDYDCPLAQASGRPFSDVWEDMRFSVGTYGRWAVDHGFDWSWSTDGSDVCLLNDEWRRVLTAASVA